MDIQTYLKEKAALIEMQLDVLVPPVQSREGKLHEAARYAILGGAKRIRPILALAATEMLGGDAERALSPACALELIHSYSLIHDDLPCMDDDDYRRSKLTVHKVYPEGHAVLTGDFLLTYAFEVLSDDPDLSPEQKVRLISVLARRSGAEGMIGGQVLDIAAEGQEIDLSGLQEIHSKKTGALICASVEFGGILSDASAEQMQLLQRFGRDIGLAFQVVDDILDVTQSQEKHGSAVGSDVENGKVTYVSLLGLERSQEIAASLLKSALQSLEQLPGDSAVLAAIAQLIVARAELPAAVN